MKKIAMIHTSTVSLEELKRICEELIPDAKIVNIIDDSLLEEVKCNNGITPLIIKRMCSYVQCADLLKPDLIFNQCSSVGEAFDVARKQTDVLTLKIDEPMAEKAVDLGTRIAVVATVSSTLKPSCNLILNKAKEKNKNVIVDEYLVNGALDILMKEKNQDKHNKLCLEVINEVSKNHDVVVLAQGSMTVLIPYLNSIKIPVLTSPRMAIEKIKELIYE